MLCIGPFGIKMLRASSLSLALYRVACILPRCLLYFLRVSLDSKRLCCYLRIRFYSGTASGCAQADCRCPHKHSTAQIMLLTVSTTPTCTCPLTVAGRVVLKCTRAHSHQQAHELEHKPTCLLRADTGSFHTQQEHAAFRSRRLLACSPCSANRS